MEIKALQLHKKASVEYKNIQDKYSFSIENKCIALSDGTTQSFKSELWASILVNNFVKKPLFDIELLLEEFKNLGAEFNNTKIEFSSNFAIASIEKNKKSKGGTATFIGIHLINDSLLRIINCGDTCLFLLRNNEIITFPFGDIEELDKNSFFINSTQLQNNEVGKEFFKTNEIIIKKDDVIILATDAISRLFLRKNENISAILNCNNFEDLKTFCETNWNNNELEEDDISVIIINPFESDKTIEIIPPKEFSFPPIIEKEFTSFYDYQNFNNSLDIQEMEQLNRMIQNLFKETNYLKNKLKLTQALLISAIALLIINTLLLFYFVFNEKSSESKVDSNNEISTYHEESNVTEKQNDKIINYDEDENINTNNNVKKTESNNQTRVTPKKDVNKQKNKVDTKNTKEDQENLVSSQQSEESKTNSTSKVEVKKDTVKK